MLFLAMACWAITDRGAAPTEGGKKRKTGFFFSGPHFAPDPSAGSGLTQRSPTGRKGQIPHSMHACLVPGDTKPGVARAHDTNVCRVQTYQWVCHTLLWTY